MKSFLLATGLVVAMMFAMYGTTGHAADASNRQQAIDIAMQQNGGDGKVLGVQTMTDASGQIVYAVKILSNGRVRVFRIRQAN
jgi:hypothetical protein